MPSESDIAKIKQPSRGQLTYGCEGQEGGPYHSRKLHVPGATSGLTIGRGYDMKTKSANQIIADLKEAGVSEDDAKTIAKAHGKSGAAATKFIKDEKLEGFEIGADGQVTLFDKSYAAEEREVKRIASKKDVVKKYGETDWDTLDPAIKDLLVDLKFRGDYTPGARALIQELVANNDVKGLSDVIGKRENWKNVPKDRFDQRKKYMEDAVKAKGLDKAPAAQPAKPVVAPPPLAGKVPPQTGVAGGSRFGSIARPMI